MYRQHRHFFTLEEKRKILALYAAAERGAKQQFLHQYGVDKSCVSRWKKTVVAVTPNKRDKKKTLHKGKEVILGDTNEQELLLRIFQLRDAMIPISGTMVKIMALQLAEQKNIQNFKASDGGWISLRIAINSSLEKGQSALQNYHQPFIMSLKKCISIFTITLSSIT